MADKIKDAKRNMSTARKVSIVEPGYIGSRTGKKLTLGYELKRREGVGFEFVDSGDSSDVLLMLPPYGTGPVCFRRIIRPLSQRYRVIVPSYPMFGSAGKGVPFDYTPSNAAQAIEHLLTALSISRLRVLAVGEAAAILFKLCDINALTIIGATIVSPGTVEANHPAALRAAARGSFLAINLSPSRDKVERVLRDAYFDQTFVTPALVDYYCGLYSSREARIAYNEAIAMYDSEPMALLPQEIPLPGDEDDPVARSLSMRAARRMLPLQIIYGEMDRWHNPDDCPVAKVYKSAQKVIIRNSASVPYIEKAEVFMQRLVDFMG